MVRYGKSCNRDSDCSSSICEMTYTDVGKPIGRKCVLQPKKYGKKCRYNRDCKSGRCVKTYDDNQMYAGKRCQVIKGQIIPKRGWPFDNANMPDILKTSERHQNVRNEEVLLSNAAKSQAFQGRGPVSEFIVLLMEIVVTLFASIIDLLYKIWKIIFDMVYDFIFGSIQFHKIFGWWRKYTCIDVTIFRYIVTLLFPPMGVFMRKGISGIGYIIICCILTMFFYFPGLAYAIIIMTEGNLQCPNKIGTRAKSIKSDTQATAKAISKDPNKFKGAISISSASGTTDSKIGSRKVF